MEAELVDGLCQRWHCLPSQLLLEDADYVLRLLQLVAPPAEGGGAAPSGDEDIWRRLLELQTVTE